MQENDFIRISYRGMIKEGGQVFDQGKEIPVVVGAGFVIPGIDEALLEMGVGEKRTVEIGPEKAFGQRDQNRIRLVPESEFTKHNTKPYPGMVVDADNLRGRVLSVSSGRVKVDFNHPLAGKALVYDLEITKRIEETEEKIAGLVEFYTKMPREKVKISAKGKETEIIVPPTIHPAFKNRISQEIIRFLGFETVKFIEIFEKPKGTPEGKESK